MSRRRGRSNAPGPTPPLATEASRATPSVAARGAILLVQLFRVVRLTLFPVKTCRFAPTCTEYAIEAFRLHGIVRGAPLALRRVARCHPFHPGGIDPVPLALT